jgi:hypothetical protein
MAMLGVITAVDDLVADWEKVLAKPSTGATVNVHTEP